MHYNSKPKKDLSMEAKKNPSKDLGLQRPKFFLIGLSLSITIIITAFEWRTIKEKPIIGCPNLIDSEAMQIIPSPNLDPPSTTKPVLKFHGKYTSSLHSGSLVIVDNREKVTSIGSIALLDSMSSLGNNSLDPPTERDTTYIFVEKKPEPVLGFTNFYKELCTSIKYPNPARRMGIEGNVFVEFVIDKNGEPIELNVIRGIGSGCDEEAMRVLALTKWEPGKQRGKPVKVKMVLPIRFRLSN